MLSRLEIRVGGIFANSYQSCEDPLVGFNRNVEKIISAALALERVRRRRPWTASDIIDFLDDEEASARPSDATVYRTLHNLDRELGLLVSVGDVFEGDRSPGRPRRSYELTPSGITAAVNAAGWLSHAGVVWAGFATAEVT